MGDTWTRDTVKWYWSADSLIWQLSIDHNMAVQYQVAAPTLARKCDISHWLPCGADEGPGRADVKSRVNQNFSDIR